MKKARAMYIPAGGKKAVWGPVDQNVLPEGYPYKEGVTIEWDGNTTGLADYGGMYRISDKIVPYADFANAQVWYTNNGSDKSIVKVTASDMTSNGIPAYALSNTDGVPLIYCIYEDYANENAAMPAGMYFSYTDANNYVSEFSTETIHQMAPEFLPAGVGGGQFVVTVTEDGDTVTADKTFAEIDAAYSGGNTLVCVLPIADNTISSYHYLDMAIPGTCYRFVSVTPGTSAPVLTAITITDGSVQKELTVLAVKA